jgi:hypothetical protein
MRPDIAAGQQWTGRAVAGPAWSADGTLTAKTADF